MRLTPPDASFLYMESASGPMHISSIFVLDGELSFDAVFQQINARLHLLPAYRRKLVQVPMNIAHPTWVDDPAFALENHVIDHELANNTRIDRAIAYAVELNEPLLDRSKPLWMVHVLRGVPGKTVMLQQTHHCMVDGASGLGLIAVIYDFDPNGDEISPPLTEWKPSPTPGPLEIFNEALSENLTNMTQNALAGQISPPPERLEMFQKAAKVMSSFVTRPVMTAPFNAGAVGPKRSLGWMKRSFNDLRHIRRAFGGTINDVVLTVVSAAVSEYLTDQNEETSDQYLRIMCPVNVRTEDQADGLGNRVSAIFPVVPAWHMPVRLRLNQIIAETARIKAGQEAQALALMQESALEPWPIALWPTQLVGTQIDPTQMAAAMPPPILPGQGPRPPNVGYNFTCTNLPGPQVPQYLDGVPVTDQMGLLTLTGNIGFGVTILSYNKTLFFSFIAEPRLLPDVKKLAARAESAFDQLLSEAVEHAAALQK